jgi:hypothetical protein
MDEHMMEEWKEKCRREMMAWEEKCRREMIEWNTKNLWNMEMFKAGNVSGQAALKSAILINGGAAVALLAFIGSIFTASENREIVIKLAGAMSYFVWGVLSGAIASGVVYVGQFVYACEKRLAGYILNGLSWLLVISCYILFVIGVVLAFKVFNA